MYYFHEHYYLWLFCFHLENVGECCKVQGVCVHQRIALYKSYYCFSRHCICKFWQEFETPDISHSQITLSFLFKGEEPCDELLLYFAFLFWFTEDVVWGHIFRLFVSFYCIAHVYNRVSFSFCSVVHDIWWVMNSVLDQGRFIMSGKVHNVSESLEPFVNRWVGVK